MVGIIIQLIISWILLWYFDKSSLAALGIAPTGKRVLLFLTGFLLAAFVSILYNILTIAFVHNGWVINKQFSAAAALQSTWWVLRSVLFEELIFRGALLYLAIKRWGAPRASIFSAVCFGVYHWFSYGALGNPVAMVFIFLLTGIAGFTFAYAFAKTGSLYLPVSLHFGWNLVHIVVFSNGPLGSQLYQKINGNAATGFLSLFIFLFQMLALPLAGFFYARWWAGRQKNRWMKSSCH